MSDYRLPEKDGIELLDEIREHHGPVPFIIMTSYADIRIAVRAMKLGAYDYVTKPVNPDEILLSIKVPWKGIPQPLYSRSRWWCPVKVSNAENGYLTGESDISKRLQEHIKLVAPTNISVLIEGESGSGKEYVAKRIHEQSNKCQAICRY